jgi:hypothetical protein
MTAGPALRGALSTTCVQKAPMNASRPAGPPPASGTPFPHCPARGPRRAQAETAYAASAFLEDEDFSDFFDESEDFEESADSFDFDFSPPSFPDRSISRFRRFVP